MYPINSITKSLLAPLLSLLLLNDSIKPISQEKIKLPIRKLIKSPWKLDQGFVAKPENLKSIVIAENDDNDHALLVISIVAVNSLDPGRCGSNIKV